jgi:hypothetical protein
MSNFKFLVETVMPILSLYEDNYTTILEIEAYKAILFCDLRICLKK